MASNRSTTRGRSAAITPPEAPRAALAAVVRHGARLQIAAFTATGTALAGWAHALDRLAQAVGSELLRRIEGETNSSELIVGVASATHTHLHELATLPAVAANHFDARVSRASVET